MTEPTCRHRLEGLEPDNLLAFLALLGLLRALEAARPAWRPRAGWEVDTAPLRPFLEVAAPVTREEVCEAAAEGLGLFRKALLPFSWPRNKTGKPQRTTVCSTPARFRRLCDLVVRTLHTAKTRKDTRQIVWQFRNELLSSGVVEVTDNGKADLEASPLKLPSARMTFVGAMFEAVSSCRVEDLRRALFLAWKYETKGDSLRLAPQEARRYAYRASDPSPEGARSERGGTALGALGLTGITFVPATPRPRLTAYVGTRQNGFFAWPIWAQPSSYSGILALLTSLQASATASFEAPPSVLGVVKSMRFVLDPNQGDYGNVAPGELFWMGSARRYAASASASS